MSGEDDLSTADERMVARIKANVGTGEAERTSKWLVHQMGKPDKAWPWRYNKSYWNASCTEPPR